MKKWVLGFCFDSTCKYVLLILKTKPDYLKGKLNGIGGKIEENDLTPYQAMVRETKEEAGIDVANWGQFAEFIVKRGTVYCFAAVNSEIWNAKSMENEQVRIERIDILCASPLPNLKWLLPMAVNFLNKEDDCLHFQVKETNWKN
jgi:8-oxo-dGTP diphosphatase